MKRLLQAMLASCVALDMAGCTGVGPDFTQPVPETVDRASFLDTGKAVRSPVRVLAGTSNAPTDAAWWSIFHDATLSRLEARVVDENLDVRTATLRVAESRAQVASTASAALPTLSATGSDTRQAFSKNALFQAGAPQRSRWRGRILVQPSADQYGVQQLFRRFRRVLGTRPLGPCRPTDRGGRRAARSQRRNAPRHARLNPGRTRARLHQPAWHAETDPYRQRQPQDR